MHPLFPFTSTFCYDEIGFDESCYSYEKTRIGSAEPRDNDACYALQRFKQRMEATARSTSVPKDLELNF
ncbi:hypothetical protein M0802_008765 [Mischocyttarus mexicanus]|nr:hypothetical protein M0802_008765 [Mischocyttarus mexicanus]